jgi:AraC-like DNA-binding protein
MNGLNFLIAVGALQGFLLSFALLMLAFSRKNPALRWLAGFVGAFSGLVTSDVLLQTRLVLTVPHTYQVFDPLIFWIGPLCFAYVRALLGLPSWRWGIKLLHFLPGLLLYALLAPGILQNAQLKRQMIAADLASPSAPGPDFFVLIACLLVLMYLLRSIWLMRQYWRDLEGEYSNTERYKLAWLAQLLAFCACVWAFWLLSVLAQAHWADWVAQLGLGVGIYALGYRGLRQPQLWARALPRVTLQAQDHPSTESNQLRSEVPPAISQLHAPAEAVGLLPMRPKYAKTGVSEADMARVGAQLQAVMAAELLFLEPELSLSELATRLQISAHTLSQTLNVHFQQSFFDYINGLRVQEVKRCFADQRFATQSILDIALASGFASKATFNATFKRLTGQTPSAARSHLNPASAPSKS